MATNPAGNISAPLSARCGGARVGATRCGWLPKDLDSVDPEFQTWTDVRGPADKEPVAVASVWTDIKT